MIDVKAVRGLTHDALGSAAVVRTMRYDGAASQAEYAALVRALAYTLGGTYQSPEWSGLCGKVRAILDAAAPEGSSFAIAAATEPTLGALLTLTSFEDWPYRYYRAEGGNIHRADGSRVSPHDEDWLLACGYVQVDIIGDVTRAVAQ
jgi:hypothetical protein